MHIGIIAALPGELKPLVRGWQHTKSGNGTHTWTGSIGGHILIAACSGMGADAARRAFSAAETEAPLDFVLSIGWAGALIHDLQPGDARVLSEIIDAQTGEHFRFNSTEPPLAVVTLPTVADTREKLRLHTTYPSAIMVDMEAATIARLAEMRGIPVACFKAVTDSVSASLPNLNPFINSMGQLRMAPFLAHVAVRPTSWPVLAHLGRDSKKASLALCNLVLKFIQENNGDQLNRTGHP
jgi:adenosylhomocysteine nucleosidase